MKRLLFVLLLTAALVPTVPAAAQIGAGGGPRYPYQSNPIDQAVRDAQRPLPRLPAAPPPAVRYVPEQRFIDPGTRKEIVIPGHEERRLSDTQVTVPPLTGYGPSGPVAIPGGDRPPAELRTTP
jgi:hypothetical protein